MSANQNIMHTMNLFTIAALGSMTIGLSYFGVLGYSKWAAKENILDVPNERSSHTEPIPRGGGLVIVILTLSGLLLYQVLGGGGPWKVVLSFMAGACLIAGVSWVDDLHSLPSGIRFSAHSLAAIVGIAACGYWHTVSFPLIGQIRLGLLGLPLTFFWIVGLTNAYNFMDGIDGIAGGQAMVAGLWWSVFGWLYQQPLCLVLGLFLASSSMGFLVHNWPPARIFMGDVGSAFLGYSFAMLPIMANYSMSLEGGWSGSFLAGILITWPFLLDTTLTFLRRLYNGEDVFRAHRTHIYQRLVIAGYSSGVISLLYMGLNIMGGIVAMLWSMPEVNP
jgi:UDP-N-acetylmuramyl pentapeptide phosphotransferase/UDP-N-acetylglucosamine-1-phosphate transferase